MVDEWRWLIGLNLVLALWLGMLADSWKGRRMGAWMAIGLCTSVFGLALLILMPKLPVTKQAEKRSNPFAPTDSYGH